MARETLSTGSTSAGTGQPVPGVRAAQKGVFRKEGEYWTVGCGGKAFRLKDTKGLGYLAHLLRHPGAEFHVLDLVGGIASQREEDETTQSVQGLPRGDEDLEKAGIHITSLGDAGEMLDEQAKTAYRHRLSELREELDEAKEVGNVERAERAEQEINALSRELSRAVGLGGRSRRAASASERARQTVTKTIRAIVERIAQSDAALGDILSRCIRTGNFCSYQPDPDFPIAWEFAATDPASTIEPVERPTSSGDAAAAACRSSAVLAAGLGGFSVFVRGTNGLCGTGDRRRRDSRGHRSRAERPWVAGYAWGRPGRGQNSPGDGDGGVCVTSWLPTLRRAVLRKRGAISLSSIRRDP